MHVPAHASRLPEDVAPIPVPDSRREAEVLLMLLSAGLYPKCADRQARGDGKESVGKESRMIFSAYQADIEKESSFSYRGDGPILLRLQRRCL